MISNTEFPKKADIFIQSKNIDYVKNYYKPSKTTRIYELIIIGIGVFLTAIIFFSPIQHTNKMLATHGISQAEDTNSSTDNSMNNDNSNNSSSSAIFSTFPTIDFTTPSASTSPFPSQLPSIEPSASPAPSVSPVSAPNVQTLTNTSSQIIALQQQVTSQMQTCIASNVQMINQIVTLQTQQQQLQNQISTIVSQMQSIDASTASGSAQQQALDQQRIQLQNQSDAIGTAINTAGDNKNTNNNQCESNVSSLEQQRATLEGNLDNTFNNAMSIPIPQPQ